jgi:hypothetical protein
MSTTITFQNLPGGCPTPAQPYSEGGLTFTNSGGNTWCNPETTPFRVVFPYSLPCQVIVTPDPGTIFALNSLVMRVTAAVVAQLINFIGSQPGGGYVTAQYVVPAGGALNTPMPAGLTNLTGLAIYTGLCEFGNLVVDIQTIQTVTFDKNFPPGCPSGTYYEEAGLLFSNDNGWCGSSGGFPNGYAIPLQMSVISLDGRPFTFISLQAISEGEGQGVSLMGTRPDGSAVYAAFTPANAGPAPQTFEPWGLIGLQKLDIVSTAKVGNMAFAV